MLSFNVIIYQLFITYLLTIYQLFINYLLNIIYAVPTSDHSH